MISIPPALRKAIEAGRFDAAEEAWLERLDEDPRDLDFFARVARAMAAAGGESEARVLLDLLDEQLQADGDTRARLELLRSAGAVRYSPEKLHAEICSTLDALYPDTPAMEELADYVGLHRAITDTKKIWDKVKRLESLLCFQEGTIVWMEGKGAGRLVEVNRALESFRVDFETQAGLAVGFRAAAKLLKPLPSDHLLHRKLSDPEALRRLAADDPPALLGAALTCYDEPRTAAQIHDDLAGIVPEKSWSSWWAGVRTHPQLHVAGGRGRQKYTWMESGGEAAAATRQAFDDADLDGKLALYSREAGRGSELAAELAGDLAQLGESAAGSNPTEAARIWLALDRRSAAPAGADWAPAALLAAADDPAALALGIDNRADRESLYKQMPEARDDWPAVYGRLLLDESEPRSLQLLADALAREDEDAWHRVLDELLGKPQAHPAGFTWLCARAVDDGATRLRNPQRMLLNVLAATVWEELRPQRARLLDLLESSTLVRDLLDLLPDEESERAATAVQRALLPDHLRHLLEDLLRRRFQELRDQEAGPLYALPESIAERERELEHLREVEVPANRKAIQEAREFGDLRENFEYKSARQRHGYLTARIGAIEADLVRAQPIEPPPDGGDGAVRVGTRARLEAGDGDERVITVLGPWESDPDAGIVSYESDLGKALLGKTAGDEIEIEIEGAGYRVTAVEPWQG